MLPVNITTVTNRGNHVPAPPAPLPRRIPRDRTRPAIRYTLEGLPAPTAFEKHRLAAEALFAQEAR